MHRALAHVLPALLLALAPALALAQSSAAPARPHRVVIQVSDNDPAKWNLALNNARNVQADLGMDNVDVEVVAYGPGLAMLKTDSAVASRVASASAQGVGVIACENTMKTTKVERSQILPGVTFVDAGVVHIMKRQREGWGYVRP
jgi:intracellular sulfur oxidation DsrE/DsrF family protein